MKTKFKINTNMTFQYNSIPEELKSRVPLPAALLSPIPAKCFPTHPDFTRASSPTDFSTEHVSRTVVEHIVGMRVKNMELYQRALVHKSIQKSIKKTPQYLVKPYLLKSNETLEFLGDAVLGLVIAEYLFKNFPKENEGFLTRIRTKLVKGKTLANFSQQLKLGPHILMSRHVVNIDGRKNKRILEDAFEAFVGAIYLDLGIDFARAFILRLVEKYINEVNVFEDDNYKDLLLRYSQHKGIELPMYNTVLQEGPPHQRTFTMEVVLFEKPQGRGKAKSKKEAEQLAAQQAIQKLKIVDDFN